MAKTYGSKTRQKPPASKWTAKHRYGDVYECSDGRVSLSHSIKGLQKAQANLESDGADFALKQLRVVKDKLEAIAACHEVDADLATLEDMIAADTAEE
jgi:hypothetical protein